MLDICVTNCLGVGAGYAGEYAVSTYCAVYECAGVITDGL